MSVLILRRTQMQIMGRAAFFLRVHAFLCERARLPAVRAALAQPDTAFALWSRVADEFDPGSEYLGAILFSYALCQACAGAEPLPAVRRLLAGPEPEYAAKCYFEDAGVLRFSEFDLPPDHAPSGVTGAV